MNSNRITVKQAAELLDMPEQLLRLGLQQGKFNFGVAVKTSTRWTYYINTNKFLEYIGVQLDAELKTENAIDGEHTFCYNDIVAYC